MDCFTNDHQTGRRMLHITGRRFYSVGFITALAASLCAGLPSANAADAKTRLNPLIEKLASGGNAVTPTDWTFIDMEHQPYSIDHLQTILADIGKTKKPNGQFSTAPIVRIPTDGDEDNRFLVKQVLDSGVMGIVFGHVENRAEAEKAVMAMRYPPQRGSTAPGKPEGIRGYGPFRAAALWGVPVAEYLQRADVWPLNPNGDLFAMIMIETVTGVKNAKEIITTPGVGAVFIGASDLGMSLGVGPAAPVTPKETEEKIAEIVKICKETKVICAFPVVNGEAEAKKRTEQGFRMLLWSQNPKKD